ncbi:MAG: ABC transporter permease [Candidatus Glassbacteria bacterium]|nr:ABC transporter permease [Candidatus Glassbacteria bacterium]
MNSSGIALPEPQARPLRVLAVWRRHQRVYFKFLVANVIPPFLEPLMMLLALGLGLADYIGAIGGGGYTEFLAPGMIAISVMFSATFETTYGTFIRMEYEKIYDAQLASPTSFFEMLLGEVAWVCSKCSIFSLGVLLVVGAFGLIPSWWSLLAVPAGFLGGMVFALMGLLVTSQVREINNFNFYMTGIITPMFFFSGVMFPLDSLPDFLQYACLCLPLTHLVAVMRAVSAGVFETALLGHLSVLLAYAAVLWPLAVVLLRRRILV